MNAELARLATAAMTGALITWLIGPRRYRAAPKKPVVKHNQRGQRTVEDIAARLELERAGRPNERVERWARFGWPAAAVESDSGGVAVPVKPAPPPYDPGAWSAASVGNLSLGLG